MQSNLVSNYDSRAIRYPVKDPVLHRCISISLSQKRFIHSSLKMLLYDARLYADMNQELVAAAVEAWRQGYDPDNNFKLIKNLAQRRMYHFLKAYGFPRLWDSHLKKQGKGFFRREVPGLKEFDFSYEFGENTALIAWCESYVTQKLGQSAWEEVICWAKSRAPEPQGMAANSISILKEVFSK